MRYSKLCLSLDRTKFGIKYFKHKMSWVIQRVFGARYRKSNTSFQKRENGEKRTKRLIY